MSNGGADQPTIIDTLTPAGQTRFDQEQRIIGQLGGVAENQLGRVSRAIGSPFPPDAQGPGLQYGFDDAGQLQRNIANVGQGERQFADVGQGPRALDFSGAPALPDASDAARQRVEDALYGRSTSRLDPEWTIRQNQLENQLANQGLRPGMEAYDAEKAKLERARTDAYQQARAGAIEAGGSEQARLFGLGLGARQQAVGEATTQGQFGANSQQQAYQQALQRAQFGNTAAQQDFQNQIAAGGFNNQAAAQQFQQAQALAAFQNQARAQALQEALVQRQLPLNELSALRSGSQVQLPQFNPYTGPTVQAPPVMQAGLAAAQQQQNAYNQQVAQNNALTSGLFNLGGMAAMGASGGTAPWWFPALKSLGGG